MFVPKIEHVVPEKVYHNLIFVGIFQSAANRARTWDYVRRKGVSMGLSLYDQDVFVAKTAGELLFDGYEDNMVLMGKQLFDASEVPFDRVGWFYTVGDPYIRSGLAVA